MDELEARKILDSLIMSNDALYDPHNYTNWEITDSDVSLDGIFDPEDLEAIAWWLRNKKKKGEKNEKSNTSK